MKARFFSFLFVWVFLLLNPNIAKPQSLVNDAATIKKNVEEYLSAIGQYGVAGQVLIADQTSIIVNKNFGYAVREKRIPVNNETIFELASTSKMFTACAILKLEMDGKLSLTDSLPVFFSRVPADKRQITIHQLLTHISGIYGGDLVEEFASVTKKQLLNKIFTQPLEATPGSKWKYSNAGYNLLAAIIEKVSGKDYATYLSETFFKPLSMRNTFVSGSKELLFKNVAYAYQGVKNKNGPDRQVFNPRTWGGGSICSTAGDLYKWVRALQQRTILNEAAWKLFSTAHVKIAKDNNYGYGCFPYQLNGKNILDAIGSTERGFNCTVRMYLDEGITYLLVANSNEPMGPFSRQFIDPRIRHFIFEKESIAVPPPVLKLHPNTLKSFSGNYVAGHDSINVFAQGDNLVLQAKGQGALDFILGYSETQKQRIKVMLKKAQLFINDFKNTTTKGFEEVLTTEQLPTYIEERNTATRQFGKLKGYTINGASFDSDTNFVVSNITMKFEKKTLNYFTMWNLMDNKTMIDFTEMGAPVVEYSKIIVPMGPQRFVSYDFMKARASVMIDIARNKNGVLELRNDKTTSVFRTQ